MTTGPRLYLGSHLWRGLSAVALFGVFAAVFLTAEFGAPVGFGEIDSVVATIGFAMFGVASESVQATGTESFLVAFVVIAAVLDAALEGAVMLARREETGEIVSALRSLEGDE